MQYFCYNQLGYLIWPLLFVQLWWKSLQNREYRLRWCERLACAPQRRQWQTGGVLIHAVSVGELNAARPVIEHLLNTYPQCPVTITTTTPAASAMAQRWFQDRCQHSYLPFDLRWVMKCFIRQLQPRLLLLLETELWPNLILQAQQSGAHTAVINARFSPATMLLFRRFHAFAKHTLYALDWIAAQTESDAERYIQAGANKHAVSVIGNLKMDVRIDPQLHIAAQQLRQTLCQRLLLVAGSTHDGEEQLVLQAFIAARKSLPRLLLVLAPRHPERADAIMQLCQQYELQVLRLGSGEALGNARDIILIDTLGQLLLWYGAADVVFLGGTLVDIGGHNPVEAAAMGTVQIIGPHHQQIEQTAAALAASGAAMLLTDNAELTTVLLQLLQDVARRQHSSSAAQLLISQQRGALVRTTDWLAAQLS